MIPAYISDLYRNNKLLTARYFLTSVGRAICSVLLVVMIQQFLAVTHKSAGHLAQFLIPLFGRGALVFEMAFLLIFVHMLNSYLGYDNRITSQRLAEIQEFGAMEKIIRRLLALSVQFFNRQSEGELIQTSREDVNALRDMTLAYAMVGRSALMALALSAIVFWLSPMLAFASLILLPFVCVPLVVYSSRRVKISAAKLRARGPYFYNAILQIITGIRIIKAYGGEETEARLSIENGKSYYADVMGLVKLQALTQVLMESIGGLSLVLVITLGGYQVTKGRMSWDALVAFIFASRSLFAPIYEIQTSLGDIHSKQVGADRVRDLLATESDIRDKPNPLPLLKAPKVIAFHNVDFGYGGPQVLHNVSFEVKTGESIGIVGPSGGGKSTLLNLIVRFYDPTSGRVTFDGEDLRDFKLTDVYSRVAIVTQEPFLFATTVRENIRCSRLDATDAEVEEAARGAWIHDDIMNLPNGYETPVGKGGRTLSRGQAQRLNVARALLRNAPLLILDEATASLDSVAEAEVQRSIDNLMQGRTCFIVAHRLSTLKNADRLIVIDRGRCIGVGRHEELYRDCPLYTQFWNLQQLGENNPEQAQSLLKPSRALSASAKNAKAEAVAAMVMPLGELTPLTE